MTDWTKLKCQHQPIQDPLTIISGGSQSPNLWKTALETLSVELRNSLDLTTVNHAYVLSRALKEAQEKKQVCAQKAWRLKKRNGETIILRDVIEKIIVWVEKFIAVGDAAVQYDTAHAALAWAAFRFVLQMAVNDKRVFGQMIENLEAVSHLITRYAILEELYLQRNSTARNKLEERIVHLYAEILSFLAEARKFFLRSGKVRLAEGLVKFSEDEHMPRIRVLDGEISGLTEVFAVDIQIETAKGVASMGALLTSLSEPIRRLVDHSSISAQVLHGNQHLQLLQWLSSVPFSSHHKRHSERRIPASGQWLLDHERYRHWRNTSSSSIFLLHGIMGSGKTSLASAVVDSFLYESSDKASSAPIAYFYCTKNSAEPERSNPDEIMRSILRQLTISHGSSSTVHETILHEYERRQAVARVDGFEITKLQAADCLKLILDTTAAHPATIIIDAVDEIQPSSRHVLLSALIQIIQDSQSVVKVFVTSRDDSNIYALLSDSVTVRIQNNRTRNDMDVFVYREVSSAIENRRMLNGVVSDNLKQELMDVLIAGAGEMFVWVLRQIESLCRMKTEADIRSAMRALPTNTLNELYAEDFTRISQSGQHTRSYAIQVFSMLLCAQEALSPEAFIQVMAKTLPQQGETIALANLIDICFNLVVLDSELNVLRFAHISFQEFLETRAEFASHCVHRAIATSCLDFCLEGLPRGIDSDLSPKDDFHHYSAVYWAEHCSITLSEGADELITGKMEEFIFDSGDVTLGFTDWIQAVNKFIEKLPNDHALAKALSSVINSAGSPLFTACVFGLTPIADILALATDYDWNQMNDSGQSGLYLAAASGHRPIVQRLLQHKVNVNIFGGKFSHPLHAACFGGHTSNVGLLLDHGADPKLGPRSALEYAILADHENIAMLLLDRRFDVSNQGEYDSILQQAAETGFSDVVQFLQKKYASLYGALGSSRCRAVDVAILKGRIGVVERYMQKLSDPKMEMPKDAIATAALGGQDAMISLLVDWGLDLNQEGVLGTPLRAASIMCRESTARLLLRLGASLHVSGSFGEPLQAAAMRGHESITRLLLSHGANVDGKGGLYGTALQAAAHRGHRKVVEILLDAGASVHRGGFSRDAFHAASEGGHEGILRLFLERGFNFPPQGGRRLCSRCNPNPNPKYRNLLRDHSPTRYQEAKPFRDYGAGSEEWRERASMIDFAHVVEKIRGAVTSEHELTLPYRAHREFKDYNHENYALREAAANGHVAVVEFLLSQLNRMGIPKSEISAAFQEACVNGHEEVVNRLLSDLEEVRELNAGFEAAALEGHLTVVDLLIDHENRLGLARVETVESPTQGTYECDSTARVILNSGSAGGHMPVFKRGQELVAQRCSDVASRQLYREALTTASTYQKVDIVENLLQSNLEFDLEELTKNVNSICAWGSKRTLQALLQHDTKELLGIVQYSSGLDQAARKHNRQVVVYWLEEHPEHQNLVVDSATVIHVARNGFMDILPPLTQRIMPMDSFEKTVSQCLQVASKNGHEQVVEYLIGEGAKVNAVVEEARDPSGGTNSLHYDPYSHIDKKTRKLSALQAALIGTADTSSKQRTVELLLGKGADPNRAEGYGRYPLNIAAAYCTVEVVQVLISSGANAETATEEYGTALQAAARRESRGLPIIKTLLEAGGSTSSLGLGKAAALNEALSFFEASDWSGDEDSGRFIRSTSIAKVLSVGPGAVVKALLANLPEEKSDDTRYGLLAQMACIAGDQECVELLIKRGMDVNVLRSYYGTALQAASRVGNIQIVDCLLKSGADVNILSGVHGTALRAAVIRGHEDLVRMLIAQGADINLRYEDQSHSVLHLALESRNIAIFELLLDAGTDINAKKNHVEHVLMLACKHGDTTLVELLLASGVDPSVSGTKSECYLFIRYEKATPLHAACANSHLPVVQLLLDHGADIEKTNESSATPLIAAVRANDLSVICSLLDAGADVNHAVDVTPLSEAAGKCGLEIVEELLSAGAIIGGASTKENALLRACRSRQHSVAELLLANLRGNEFEVEVCHEALSAAIECGHCEMVHLLLEHGLSPSFGMIRQACAVGVLEVVKMLVDAGIDVNEDDGDDEPLLHVAACHSRPDIVKFLISRGANTTLRSVTYGSPLIAALEGTMAPFLCSCSQPESCRSLAMKLPRPTPRPRKHKRFPMKDEDQQKPGYKEILQCEQIVQILFDASVEIDTTIRKFGNALHLASYMGSEVIVRQLLERTEDINVVGGYFESPLIAGLKGDHPTVVDLLLDRGSNVNQFLPEHGSALHYACGHGSKRSIQSLLDHGADINAYDDRHCSVLATAISHSPQGNRIAIAQRMIVELLLCHKPKLQLRECDLLAAASCVCYFDGQDFMRLLLHHDATIVATEAVIVKTIQSFRGSSGSLSEALRLVLEHDGGLGTTPAMVDAADDESFRGSLRAQNEVINILLENKPFDQATADRLKSMSK